MTEPTPRTTVNPNCSAALASAIDAIGLQIQTKYTTETGELYLHLVQRLLRYDRLFFFKWLHGALGDDGPIKKRRNRVAA